MRQLRAWPPCGVRKEARSAEPGSWIGRLRSRRSTTAPALVVALLASAVATLAAPERAAATPATTVVVTNPSFATIAVDAGGTAWGYPTTAQTQLWRSTDEARTFTRVNGWDAIGRRPWYMNALSTGTLLAHYDTGSQWAIARSADNGATWTTVLRLPCIATDCTTRYTTLTDASIAEGGGDIYLGTYNNIPGATLANYIYRSSDDGRTWAVVNTTTDHRHIHAVLWDPTRSRLFVLFGDSSAGGIWMSDDRGQTLAPACTANECVAVDAIPADGNLVYGLDDPFATSHVYRLDPATGTRTTLFTMRYPSYSAARSGSVWLVGETHEPGMDLSEPRIHLYGSDDAGTTWTSVYDVAIPSTSSDYRMLVTGVFPNGHVAVWPAGQGTVVLGFGVASGPPVNVSAPVVSGVAVVGSSLSASAGSWSGSPSSFAYGWRRCDAGGGACVAIAGAASSSYVVATADAGFTLRVRVTATNGAGSASADSAPTAVVTAPSAGGSFGASAAGTLSGAPGAGYKFGSPYPLASAGTTASFAFWAQGGSVAQSFTPAIYTSSGSGPGSLLAVGQPVTVAAGQTAGWVSSPLPAVPLAAGTYYLVLQSGTASNGASVFYDAGSATDGVYNQNLGAPSNPFGTFNTEPRRWSFQVTLS